MEDLRRAIGEDLDLKETEFETPEGQSIKLDIVARGQNLLADAVTSKKFDPFDAANRFDVDVKELRFLVLDKMIVVAESLYEKAKARKLELKSKGARGKTRPGERLRDRKPW